jgi:hypothetical protein
MRLPLRAAAIVAAAVLSSPARAEAPPAGPPKCKVTSVNGKPVSIDVAVEDVSAASRPVFCKTRSRKPAEEAMIRHKVCKERGAGENVYTVTWGPRGKAETFELKALSCKS